MAITNMSATRIGSVTLVIVVSDLVGTVYYHWYLDGAWVGSGTAASFSFSIELDSQARVECVDTLDPYFDALAAAPAFFPARYTVHWVRSLSADVEEYLVEYEYGWDPGWVTLARVPHNDGAWDYTLLSHRLDDVTSYGFRISPIDRAGNAGSALAAFNQAVYRVPDAPRWGFAWDAGTQRVTYAAA